MTLPLQEIYQEMWPESHLEIFLQLSIPGAPEIYPLQWTRGTETLVSALTALCTTPPVRDFHPLQVPSEETLELIFLVVTLELISPEQSLHAGNQAPLTLARLSLSTEILGWETQGTMCLTLGDTLHLSRILAMIQGCPRTAVGGTPG